MNSIELKWCKDEHYGIGDDWRLSPRFFPGDYHEALRILEFRETHCDTGLVAPSSIFTKESVDELTDLGTYKKNDYDKITDEHMGPNHLSLLTRVSDSFKDRFKPVENWTPLDLWMSAFYKCISYEMNPVYGKLIELKFKTYSGWNSEGAENAKDFLNENNLIGAVNLVYYGSSSIEGNKNEAQLHDNVTLKIEGYTWDLFFNLVFSEDIPKNEQDSVLEKIKELFNRNTWIFNPRNNRLSFRETLASYLKVRFYHQIVLYNQQLEKDKNYRATDTVNMNKKELQTKEFFIKRFKLFLQYFKCPDKEIEQILSRTWDELIAGFTAKPR